MVSLAKLRMWLLEQFKIEKWKYSGVEYLAASIWWFVKVCEHSDKTTQKANSVKKIYQFIQILFQWTITKFVCPFSNAFSTCVLGVGLSMQSVLCFSQIFIVPVQSVIRSSQNQP